MTGFAEMEKSGCAEVLTVTEIVIMWKDEPLTPVMVTEYVPRCTEAATETVTVEVTI